MSKIEDLHLALTALSRNGLYNEYSCSLTASGKLKQNRFFFFQLRGQILTLFLRFQSPASPGIT